MYCTACGSEVTVEAAYCPHCGAELSDEQSSETVDQPVQAPAEERPWYDRGVYLLVWALIFFPVSLYGIYRNGWMAKELKQIMAGLIGAYTVAFVLAVGFGLSAPIVLVFVLSLIGLFGVLLLALIKPSAGFWWHEEGDVSRSYVFSVGGSVLLATLVGGTIFTGIAIQSVEAQKTAERYEANRSSLLQHLDSLGEAGEPEALLDTAGTYTSDLVDQPVLDSLVNVARADTMYQRVLEIPASDVEANIESYRRLTELDPNRELFQQKLKHYQAVKEQQEAAARERRRREKEEAQEQRRREKERARREYMYSQSWANDNESMAWVMCQDFVERRLRAPGTASFPWSTSIQTAYLGGGRFRIRAYVDAENAFGGEVRTHFTCTIEHSTGDRWKLISLDMN